MGFPHAVRRGDSLWNLAGRYLGNHSRWPAIHDYHNLGRIAQQNLSPTRHRDNWELALSAEQGTLSRTLRTQGHDEAFLELVGGMEMAYDPAGIMATIRPSLALQAGLGCCTL